MAMSWNPYSLVIGLHDRVFDFLDNCGNCQLCTLKIKLCVMCRPTALYSEATIDPGPHPFNDPNTRVLSSLSTSCSHYIQ